MLALSPQSTVYIESKVDYMNETTKLIWEHLADALISFDKYGEPITAGLAHCVAIESIYQLMESTPGTYEFLLEIVGSADFAQIANLVNQTK